MNPININTVPTIPTRIPKKTTEISWLSDAADRGRNSFDNAKKAAEEFKKSR